MKSRTVNLLGALLILIVMFALFLIILDGISNGAVFGLQASRIRS